MLYLPEHIGVLARQADELINKTSVVRNFGNRPPFAGFLPILVDDDQDQVFLLMRAFAKARLPGPVEALFDGESAMAYLSARDPYSDRRRHPIPSLVILDLKLPRMDGFEVLEWIRKESGHADLPVVVLTSSTRPEDVERAGGLGADLYLSKPVGLDNLVETVRTIAGFWLTRDLERSR